MELATYLQVDCVIKKFEDLFIYNLNTRTLDNQLDMIKNNPLFKDFGEIALKFKKKRKPSVSGLYILESFDEDDEIYLHLKSIVNRESKLVYTNDDNDKSRLLSNYKGIGGELRIVMQFCDSLIISDWGDFFRQYNLVTDEMNGVSGVWNYCKLCCDNEYLYALDHDVKLKVFVFRSINFEEQLEVSRKITFKSIKIDFIISSICYNGKLYILYFFEDDYKFDKNFGFDIDKMNSRSNQDNLCYLHLLILCTKTFTILNNFKIKDRLNTIESYSTDFGKFSTIFYDKKNLKLFVYTGERTPILVFDIRKEKFYFVENTVSAPLSQFNDLLEFRTDYNNNIIYKLARHRNYQNKHHKITAYECVNEKFVDTGFECDYFGDWVSMYFV